MPDLDPRPLTPADAAFRREFYRHWGRENCIVSGNARRAEYRPFRQMLSIKCVARGTETYHLDRRHVTVSDDTFLVLNEGRVYGSLIDAPSDTYSFSIFFRPGLGAEIAAGFDEPLDRVLDGGGAAHRSAPEFDESLRPHDSAISPVLRHIQRHVAAGWRDEAWLEEQCQFLVARLVRAHRAGAAPRADVASLRAAQRGELDRRVKRALDFMHSHLSEPLSLADIAAAVHLSPFHFLRVFRIATGRTPAGQLRILRTRRAQALFETTALSHSEIASRVGMSRSSLWRGLKQAPRAPGARVSFLGG